MARGEGMACWPLGAADVGPGDALGPPSERGSAVRVTVLVVGAYLAGIVTALAFWVQ